jgi:hypothetical protein
MKLRRIGLALLTIAGLSQSQTTPPRLDFDVALIKPAPHGKIPPPRDRFASLPLHSFLQLPFLLK